jgi:hypothetical protein
MRLVAVVAVLVGVAVWQGPQCPNGMIADAAYLTHDASPPMAVAAGQHCALAMAMAGVSDHPQDTAALCTAPSARGALPLVADSSGSFGDMGVVLATCLVFLVAVLAAVAGLSPWRLRSVVRRHAPGPGVRVCTIAVRAPSLAQLRVLRT